MPERVLRKLNKTMLQFTHLPDGGIEVFGKGVETETESKVTLKPGESFEVRVEESKLFLVVKESTPIVPPAVDEIDIALDAAARANSAMRPLIQQTHTYVTMDLTPAAYDEIAAKMREAKYDHAFNDEGEIDMAGIAVVMTDANRWEVSLGKPPNDEGA